MLQQFLNRLKVCHKLLDSAAATWDLATFWRASLKTETWPGAWPETLKATSHKSNSSPPRWLPTRSFLDANISKWKSNKLTLTFICISQMSTQSLAQLTWQSGQTSLGKGKPGRKQHWQRPRGPQQECNNKQSQTIIMCGICIGPNSLYVRTTLPYNCTCSLHKFANLITKRPQTMAPGSWHWQGYCHWYWL